MPLLHELLDAGSSGLGTVNRGTGSEAGNVQTVWSLGSETALIPSTLAWASYNLAASSPPLQDN